MLNARFTTPMQRRDRSSCWLEADPADRLFDLGSLQPGNRDAVDHRQRNLFDVDIEGAQVLAVKFAIGADMLLEGDAAVAQNLFDAPAALAVGTGVNAYFHSPLVPPICTRSPGLTDKLIPRLSKGYTHTINGVVICPI